MSINGQWLRATTKEEVLLCLCRMLVSEAWTHEEKICGRVHEQLLLCLWILESKACRCCDLQFSFLSLLLRALGNTNYPGIWDTPALEHNVFSLGVFVQFL